MTRTGWQELAERYLLDAGALMDAKRWPAAYYLAGYAVECGLKACVVRCVASEPELVFADRKFSDKCFTHNIAELVKVAGLEAELASELASDAVFQNNWIIVRDWSEQSRYSGATYNKARKFYRAVSDDKTGVMRWVRSHW